LQFSSNWDLSTARATEIVRVLIVRDGFDAASLSAAGYAEYHPIASNGTPEGRGMNRRVDIVILGHGLTEHGLTAAAVPQAETPGSASAAGPGKKPSANIPQPTAYSTNSR
jgi:chemotaxis protein MotB